MKIGIAILLSMLVNYLIITTIVDSFLMGTVHFHFSMKYRKKEFVMRPFHHNPFLRFLIPDGADFEAVFSLLRGDCAGIDRVHQDFLNHGEIPNVPPVLRVFAVAERGKTAGELAFLRF